MSELRRVLRGEASDALLFTGSNLLNRVGGLLLLPLYWTKLAPQDYGVLATIAVIGAFQALLSSMSLDLAITRFYYEWRDDERRRNLGAIWIWNGILTVAVAGAFLATLPIVAPILFPDVTDVSILLLGVVANAVTNLFLIPSSTIRIKRMPRLYAAYNLLGFLVASALGLWLVLVLDLGVVGMVISMLGSSLVLAAVGVGAMLQFAQPALSSPGLREAFSFSIRAVPAGLINTTAQILDRFLLGLFTDLQTLGLYSVAQRFVDVIPALHSSLKMAYGPFMMKNITTGGRAGREIVLEVTPYYMIPYFIVGVALAAFIGPLIRLIGQPEYFGVESIVPWLAVVAIVGTFYFYYSNGLFLAKRTGLLLVPATVYLLVLGALGLLLVGPYQIAGLIAARIAGAIALLGLSLYLSQKYYYLDHRWGAIVRLSVAAAVFGVIGQAFQLDSLALEIAVKAVGLAGFAALSVLLVGGRTHLTALRGLLGSRSASDQEPDATPAPTDPSWPG